MQDHATARRRVQTEADPVAFYDRVARLYDLFNPPWERRRRRASVRELLLEPGSAVLVPGCGTGADLPLLVDAVGRGGRVIGLDPAQAMLQRAALKVQRQGWQNVTLLWEDARALSADLLWTRAGAREVDAVLFSYVLSTMRDWDSIVEKAFALLKPGGRCVIVDLKTVDGPLRILNRSLVAVRKRTGASDPSRPISGVLARYARDVKVTTSFSGLAFTASATKPRAGRLKL